MSECKTCLGRCDAQIHESTLRIHRWFKAKICRSLEPRPIIAAPPRTLPPTPLAFAAMVGPATRRKRAEASRK